MGILAALGLFWKGLPAPIRRLIEYAGIILVALWALKVFWLNPHDNKVAAEERSKVTDEIKKDFDKRYQTTIEDLKTRNSSLESKTADLERQNSDLAKTRESIVTGFNKTLASIKQIEVNNHAEDRIIPDYLLGARLRDVSNAIECAKPANRGRAGCPDSTTNLGSTP